MRLIQVVLNADLRCNHKGLKGQAKRVALNLDDLLPNNFVLFINRKKNQLKLFAHGNTFAHYKTPDGKQMNMKAISLVPKYFNGKQLNFEGAIAETIRTEFRV